MTTEPEKTLDLRGKRCPYTLMDLSAAMRTMREGAVMEVLVDGPDGVEEIKAWCEATGREFEEPDGIGTVRVRVRKASHG
jgi:TusA-related sulfurtransferase